MFVYILMFLSMWTMSAIVLIKNRGHLYHRWMGILLLLGGSSSFSFAVHLTILPYLQQWNIGSEPFYDVLRWISIPCMIAYWVWTPWVYFVTALMFTHKTGSLKARYAAAAVSALPALLSTFNVLGDSRLADQFFVLNVTEVRWIDACYVAAGVFLYIYAYVAEADPTLKQVRARNTLVFVSIMLWAFFSDFIGIDQVVLEAKELAVESNGVWEYNYLLIFALLLFFLYYGLRFGFLGIQFRLEQHKLDVSMRALMMGTSILNHTIKNEVGKIQYLHERARRHIRNGESADALTSLNHVEKVADFLLEMANRIKEKADDLTVEPAAHPLAIFLEVKLSPLLPFLERKNIRLEVQLDTDGELYCDALHVGEVFNNLCMNAIEAMESGRGVLRIRTFAIGNDLGIEIKDNGHGIAEEHLEHIFEPFFTTKRKPSNYGLGLSYAYNVMQKHGGQLVLVESAPGQGTTMLMRFPQKSFTPFKGSAGEII